MKKVLAVGMIFVFCLGMVGCKETTQVRLQKLISNEEQRLNKIEHTYDGDIKVDAAIRGESIVYNCVYTIEIPDVKMIEKEIEVNLKKQKGTIDNTLKVMREQVPELKSIIYEYRDKSGKIIYKKEFR